MPRSNTHNIGVHGMSYVDEIINEVQEMTPDEGFNVCRFEEHGADRLTLLAHFGTFEEAKDFAESIESDDIIYIYGNNEAGEAKYSSVKNHNIDTYLKMAEDDYFEDKHTPNEEYEKTNWFDDGWGRCSGFKWDYRVLCASAF